MNSTDEPAVSGSLPRSESRASSRTRTRPAARPSSPHTHRFRIVTGVLGGLGVAALLVALAVGVAGRTSQPAHVAWSPWAPAESGALGARDIADHVAPLYRISSVNQLAVVTVVNLESAAAQAAAASAATNGTTAASPGSGLQVAIKENPASGQVSLLGGNTIAFNLCGIGGKNCAIGVGTPSRNRLLLLRREALELALYTFKYVGGVSNVVAILPPGRTLPTSQLSKSLPTTTASASKPLDVAVLFDRQELAPLLAQPLHFTLPEQFPPSVADVAKAPEAGLVDQVTGRGLFSEQLQQTQDGSNLIVLNPLPPQ